MSGDGLRQSPDGVLVPVRVTPRARRGELAGWREGRLLLRVTAPPVEGAANAAARALLAGALGVPPGRVELTAGRAGREKTFLVRGITVEQARVRLEAGA